MGFVKEFREFALKGNVLDLAVGVIIGAAFGKIVNSMVNDILMPPIGMMLGKVDFSDWKYVFRHGAPAVPESKDLVTNAVIPAVPAVPEVALRFGTFINVIIEFTIVAFCVFLVIKAFNTARKRFEAQEKAMPPPPAPPSNEEKLLAEIRDLLKQR